MAFTTTCAIVIAIVILHLLSYRAGQRSGVNKAFDYVAITGRYASIERNEVIVGVVYDLDDFKLWEVRDKEARGLMPNPTRPAPPMPTVKPAQTFPFNAPVTHE